ncbi:hypothetical protein [Mesorhizobium helmanticense]|uniref:hypothetical protein n=1 Tax=Mesorhizobium helmanticense TaxID=1776423 RepID=UPI001ABF4D54|nr:hypothetical protein [Mesorhizobium helmanticense]
MQVSAPLELCDGSRGMDPRVKPEDDECAWAASRSKRNGPLFSGPFVVEIRSLISWPVRQEPVRAPGLARVRPVQAPGPARVRPVQALREPVRRASSVQLEQAPVC